MTRASLAEVRNHRTRFTIFAVVAVLQIIVVLAGAVVDNNFVQELKTDALFAPMIIGWTTFNILYMIAFPWIYRHYDRQVTRLEGKVRVTIT